MNNPIQDQGEGFLVIRVSTAGGAIPLAGAEVIIRGKNRPESDIMINMQSSDSGLTDKVPLPAPVHELSEVPGNVRPYAEYNIEVRIRGYYSQYYNKVPVFDGITSYQNAVMIPVSENINPDNFTYDSSKGFESIEQNL